MFPFSHCIRDDDSLAAPIASVSLPATARPGADGRGQAAGETSRPRGAR